MAIAYVGGQKGSFAGKTAATTVTFALTGGLASVPAANDLVIVAYAVGSTVDRALTIQNASAVDYTLIGTELYQNDTFDANLRVAYRFMPATPETTMVLSGTGSTADAGAYTIHVYRGVDLTTPLDVAAVTAGNINTRLANPGAITPTTTGAWIHVVGAAACGTGGTFTAAYLTDLQAQTQVDTNDVNIGSGYVVWTSGAYDPAAFGGGGTDTVNDSWTAVTAALRPAAGAVIEADGAASGAAASVVDGRSVFTAVQSATGSAVTAVVGAALWLSLLAATGAATGDALGSPVFGSPGSSLGGSTIDGIGASPFAGLAGAVGTATLDGVSGATAKSDGSSVGLAIDTVVGATILTRQSTSAGLATVDGVSGVVQGTPGTSAGSAGVNGIGVSPFAGVASADGNSVDTGVGVAPTSVSGSSSGVATAQADGQDITGTRIKFNVATKVQRRLTIDVIVTRTAEKTLEVQRVLAINTTLTRTVEEVVVIVRTLAFDVVLE